MVSGAAVDSCGDVKIILLFAAAATVIAKLPFIYYYFFLIGCRRGRGRRCRYYYHRPCLVYAPSII